MSDGEPDARPVTPTGTAQLAPPKSARILALGAVAGPVLFTVAWAVLGFVSPGYTLWDILIAPYSAVSQPMSGLGLGPTAPIMNGAFVLSGLLLLAGVTGVFDVHAQIRGRVRAATVARGLSTKDGAAPRALVLPAIAEWHVGWSSRGGRSC